MIMKKINKKGQLKIQAGKNLKRFLVPLSSTKSQLKIQEMAFFLVAIILFFVLVSLFVLSIVFSNLSQSATEIAEQRTLSSITNLAASPEFSCGEPNCVDADKLIALMQNRKYENFWPFSSLSVRRQHAFSKTEGEMIKCSISNYPNCDIFEVYDRNVENERTIASYVALCKKEVENNFVYNKCEIAEFIAGTELK